MESCACLNARNILGQDPNTILVDVRTQIEWQNLSTPNIRTNQLFLIGCLRNGLLLEKFNSIVCK